MKGNSIKVTESTAKQEDKEFLLSLARNSIISYLSKEELPEINDVTGWPSEQLGAFVSIHKNGELRGCLGRFISNLPLYQLVQKLAIEAASRDYRFEPVKIHELNEINLEISVLSSLKPIRQLNELIIGKHGIYIKKGNRSGTFLPQVAIETGWDVQTFVSRCSQDKARLGWDGWKDAELYVYTAEIFSEKS